MLSNDFPPRQPFVHRLCTKKSLLSTSYPLVIHYVFHILWKTTRV